MEQAEFATRSTDFRGSGGIHRVLDALGRFFLGIGTEAPSPRRRGTQDRWWDREDDEPADAPEAGAGALAMTLGEQATLFDDEGRVTIGAVPEAEPVREPVRPAVRRIVPNTVISAQTRVNGRITGITVTRAATLDAAPSNTVAVAAAREVAAGRAIARHLVMSQSILSGKEETRRFSVPRRSLRPHFLLFEGCESVVEDGCGGYRLNQRNLRTQRGQVWFV